VALAMLVEFVNDRGESIGSTRSSSDGFYVMPGVKPGKYRLRISPAQAQNLALTADGEATVIMPADPDFISGIDFTLRKRAIKIPFLPYDVSVFL